MRTAHEKRILAEYYRDPGVRARLLEFMGGHDLESVTAEYITADDSHADVKHLPYPTCDLWKCLDNYRDVGRSLWDCQSLTVDLDIEYVNFDQPALPFVQPGLCYDLQKPVVSQTQRWLAERHIAPLHWISGQGHHFAWRIHRNSEAFGQLAQLGHLTHSLHERYKRPSEPNFNRVGLEMGAAFSGLGMVLEFVAQEVRQRGESESEIPVTLTAIEAGPVRPGGHRQREVASIDISEYGDPLDTRGLRMPFSVYLKPNQKRNELGDPFVDALPPIFPIPLFEMDIEDAIDVMRDYSRVMDLASKTSTAIPDYSDQTLQVIDCYKSSSLAEFHASFYREQHDDPEQWPDTYDKTPLDALPACVRQPLQQPNDWLLKPSVIQHVTRTLMSHNWSPRHIAGLIRSRYERDFGWGERWYRYDATSRADFYVRMFAGAIIAGYDNLIDFNCVSTQEKQFCPVEHCSNNLKELQDRLYRIHRSNSGNH